MWVAGRWRTRWQQGEGVDGRDEACIYTLQALMAQALASKCRLGHAGDTTNVHCLGPAQQADESLHKECAAVSFVVIAGCICKALLTPKPPWWHPGLLLPTSVGTSVLPLDLFVSAAHPHLNSTCCWSSLLCGSLQACRGQPPASVTCNSTCLSPMPIPV